MARAEKIAQPEYLDCIIGILKQNPQAKFLWTGVQQHVDVQKKLEDAHVVDRTHYIGWVDTGLYSRVLDIHCDTFPLCNGITLLNSMAAGTACVSTDSLLSYFGRDLLPALSEPWQVDLPAGVSEVLRSLGDLRLPVARSPQEYVDVVNTLIRHPLERSQVGSLLARIHARLYANEDVMGAAFVRHLDQLCSERLQKTVTA